MAAPHRAQLPDHIGGGARLQRAEVVGLLVGGFRAARFGGAGELRVVRGEHPDRAVGLGQFRLGVADREGEGGALVPPCRRSRRSRSAPGSSCGRCCGRRASSARSAETLLGGEACIGDLDAVGACRLVGVGRDLAAAGRDREGQGGQRRARRDSARAGTRSLSAMPPQSGRNIPRGLALHSNGLARTQQCPLAHRIDSGSAIWAPFGRSRRSSPRSASRPRRRSRPASAGRSQRSSGSRFPPRPVPRSRRTWGSARRGPRPVGRAGQVQAGGRG